MKKVSYLLIAGFLITVGASACQKHKQEEAPKPAAESTDSGAAPEKPADAPEANH